VTPVDIGLPPVYTSFRDAQTEAIEFCLESDKRFVALGLPTGSGKTLTAAALAKLLGGRTVVLTSTLGLQDQYVAHLGPCGLVDVRGRANYPCWEGGNCEEGSLADCGDKEGCPYISQTRLWNASEFGSTSYAWWLAAGSRGKGSALPDTLICDEAGLASEWLSKSVDFKFTTKELNEMKVQPRQLPGESFDEWSGLAATLTRNAEMNFQQTRAALSNEHRPGPREKLKREIKRLDEIRDRVQRLAGMDTDNFVITKEEAFRSHDGHLWKFECVWPGRYRERLFRGVERVILMSASLRPKTLSLLGISKAECDFREWPRQFPAINGPVIWVPTTRVNHRMSAEDEQTWLERIDEIIDARSDRKGLIHSVSYARARQIVERSRHRNKMVWNDNQNADSPKAAAVFELFKQRPASSGSVLVSPSFSTGWDFKGDLAEYQIIVKLPQPDTRSKVMQARIERDRGYPDYLCAQELVQACGRVVRGENDRGETIIIDDTWSYFRTKADDSIPRWYKVRREEALPKPLPKLVM
jgi:Rad3-related DNA helicase